MTVMRSPALVLARVLTRGVAVALVVAPLTAFGPLPAAGATGERDGSTAGEYGRVLLVLDSSGSMEEPAAGGQSKIEAAKEALGRVVDDLPGTADVGLRVFGSEVFSRDQPGACTDSQLVVPPGADNRDELRAAIAAYRPFGETPIAHALTEAAGDLGDGGTRSIVLVSDGVATCEPDPCEVAADLAEAGIDLRVDVVGLGVDARARDQLSCIAREGNGEYYDADSAEDIVEQLQTVATRAVRPFEVDGTPVEGGTELDPTTIPAGLWTDEVAAEGAGEEESRWFRYERTIPGSSVHVSAVSLGTEVRDSLDVDVSSAEGLACWSGFAAKQLVSSELVSTGVTVDSSSEPINEECVDGPLRIAVSRGTLSAGQTAAYGLQVVEEPPVGDLAELPPSVGRAPEITVDPVDDSPEPVQGGSSFGTATEVAPGAYTSSTVAGETQVFKVPVSWGQTLTARVVTPAATGAIEEASTRVLGPFASVAVHNPLRRTSDTLGGTTTGFAASSVSNELSTGTGEVRYRNREDQNAFDLAGFHYIEYAVGDDEGLAGLELPYRLEVAVVGEEDGVPEYAGGASLVTGGTGPDETEDPDAPDEGQSPPAAEGSQESAQESTGNAPEDAQGTAAEDSDDPVRLLIAGGLGLVAVAAVGLGVLLLRRSRPQQ